MFKSEVEHDFIPFALPLADELLEPEVEMVVLSVKRGEQSSLGADDLFRESTVLQEAAIACVVDGARPAFALVRFPVKVPRSLWHRATARLLVHAPWATSRRARRADAR